MSCVINLGNPEQWHPNIFIFLPIFGRNRRWADCQCHSLLTTFLCNMPKYFTFGSKSLFYNFFHFCTQKAVNNSKRFNAIRLNILFFKIKLLFRKCTFFSFAREKPN